MPLKNAPGPNAPRGRAARALALAAGLALAGAADLAQAAASDLFYERTLMTAADSRCRLFAPALSGALDAARAQARGASLRAGMSQDALAGIEQRAVAKAGGLDCRAPDLATAAARVRKAFEGYAHLQRMTYPGDQASWQADRASSATIPIWRLSQPAGFRADRLMFGLAGLAGQAPRLYAVASFADGAQPYAARLVLRDPSRTQGPYLNSGAARGLAANAAPRAASQVFAAETRDPMAPPTLLPTGAKTGMRFRFPSAAADAMGRLDPREAVTVEFLVAGRTSDDIRRAYVEVGDFAAGRAFLR